MKTFQAKKIYYTISEVSRIVSVPSYMLRYWESEFPQLTPARNKQGNRIYTNKEIAFILRIKHLTQSDGYTFEKVRELLASAPLSKEHIQTTDSLLANAQHELNLDPQMMNAPNALSEKEQLLKARDTLRALIERLR